MLSLTELRPVSAELTETGCRMALHYCADHLGDADRKRCRREGPAQRWRRWGELPPEGSECVIM